VFEKIHHRHYPTHPPTTFTSPTCNMKDCNIKIDVYHAAPSRSDRVIWAINELGLEDCTTTHDVSIMAGDHKKAEIKELNPLMQVPTVVLTDGEGRKKVVTESCAIPAVLSEMCDDKLSPPRSDVFSRATYHRVNAMVGASIDSQVAAVMWNEKLASEETKDMKAAAKGRADFKTKGAVVLKKILGDSQYICGPDHDEFTMADVSLAWILFLADKCNMLDEEPKLKAYLNRCLERPGWKKVHG